MTLIAEDVLLLLLDDESGKIAGATTLDAVLGGALLIELALDGLVAVTVPERRWASARVRVSGPALPAEPILRDALRIVREKERRAQDLVPKLGKGRKAELLDRLVQRGLVRREEDRVLGLFPRTRWPAADSRHEQELRGRLHAVLVDGADPDPRTAAVVAVLKAADQVHTVVTAPGVSKREIKRRAEAVAEGAWAATAVREAIQAATTAMITAVVAASAVASAGSS